MISLFYQFIFPINTFFSKSWLQNHRIDKTRLFKMLAKSIIFREMPFFAWLISQQLIKFLSCLHFLNIVFLSSISLQILKESINSLHSNPERRNRINNTVVPIAFKGFQINIRSLAELSHISQQKHRGTMTPELLSNHLKLFRRV